MTWSLSLLALALAFTVASLTDAGPTVLLVHLHPPVEQSFAVLAASIQEREQQSQHKREQLRWHTHEFLSAFVQASQQQVTAFLQANIANATITPLWIQNTLLVRVQEPPEALDQLFSNQLRLFPGVISVEHDSKSVQLLNAVEQLQLDEPGGLRDARDHDTSAAQHNVELLHAPALWKHGGSGAGVTVASIDSGVRYTHEALWATFRGNPLHKKTSSVNFDYAFWFTPETDMSKETPDTADLVGHGTHTMGTAVGRQGIGVAPNATWITARAFDIYGAANKSDFLEAAQWVICPTKRDGSGRNCSLGADVLTNSFGVSRTDAAYSQWKWLSNVLHVWRTAGSYAVFASGNTNGFLCGSVYYPASHSESIAVGALVGGRSLWGASGKGPSTDDEASETSSWLIKPDFVAPGVGIRSALSIKDTSYTRLTGTSMATPHVAGALALLLSLYHQAHPAMADVVQHVQQTATRDLGKPFLVPSECGNTSYRAYPNNIYGYGLPNVCQAALKMGFPCSEALVSASVTSRERIFEPSRLSLIDIGS